MWKVLLFIVLCSTGLLVTIMGNDNMLGKGRWFVHAVLDCEDQDQYKLPIEITRKKINRTHDGFNMHVNLDRQLNETYGVSAFAYKEVDGGFKFYTEYSGENMCSFLEEHTKGNWVRALEMANVNPPGCPIPEGELTIKELVIDYGDLTESGIYGKYDVAAYLTFAKMRIACTRWLLSFEEDYDE